MIEVACQCEGLPAHSHLPTRHAVVDGVYQGVYDDPFYVRVWVDWREYARQVMLENVTSSQPGEDPVR